MHMQSVLGVGLTLTLNMNESKKLTTTASRRGSLKNSLVVVIVNR